MCLKCAGLEHLEYLASGDPAVTRRATRYSTVHVVVMKKSPAADATSGHPCGSGGHSAGRGKSAADAERAQQQEKGFQAAQDRVYIGAFAQAIAKQFPRCPEEDAQEIAGHACQKYSGRVADPAAAKQFDPTAVRLAVIAHVRHKYTNYDELLAV